MSDNAPRTVTREQWLTERHALLKKEKALTRMRDLVSAERRRLPRVRVETDYIFDTPSGKQRLADLFGEYSQLIVHHLMFDPDWDEACVGCTFQADHIEGPRPHLAHQDTRIVAVSRAPLTKLQAYRERLGWQFEWVSSYNSDFNYDFGVSFTPEQIASGEIDYNFGTITTDPRYLQTRELPGVSVFSRDEAGQIYHTYSTYARGLDELIGMHHYQDLTSKGRSGASGPGPLRRRDEY
ncbi:DUF899 domain-containing protein [Arhodomonas sp. AD133]|uniref:DUF899 domain-containing protein n=1 Tax=Arhodomonas sp. AD133 TaxID=3415009 RepID=UPI003EC05664